MSKGPCAMVRYGVEWNGMVCGVECYGILTEKEKKKILRVFLG